MISDFEKLILQNNLGDSEKVRIFAKKYVFGYMKQKKRELMMQELGKYCLDMSKLIFGGVILAGIMNLGVENVYLFGVGGILVAFFAAIGFTFYSKSR